VAERSRISGLHGIGVAIVAAVVLGYFPSRVAAECGDYVIILNKPTDKHILPHLPAHPDSPGKHDPVRLHCSDSPPTPSPLAGFETVSTDSKESIDQLTDKFDLGNKPRWHSTISHDRPIHMPRSIFHPPRRV
jgi:hypothetical protein